MTPSGWHDGAMGRDAGHDEMQAETFRHLKQKLPTNITRETIGGTVSFTLESLFLEALVSGGNFIKTFVDILAVYKGNAKSRLLICFEIKPSIDSVGAVIRQCKATEFAILNSDWRQHNPVIEVLPVVSRRDPKTRLLCELWGCVVCWNEDDNTFVPVRWHHDNAKIDLL